MPAAASMPGFPQCGITSGRPPLWRRSGRCGAAPSGRRPRATPPAARRRVRRPARRGTPPRSRRAPRRRLAVPTCAASRAWLARSSCPSVASARYRRSPSSAPQHPERVAPVAPALAEVDEQLDVVADDAPPLADAGHELAVAGPVVEQHLHLHSAEAELEGACHARRRDVHQLPRGCARRPRRRRPSRRGRGAPRLGAPSRW